MKLNLFKISPLPSIARPNQIHGRDPDESNPLTTFVNRIIDHALNKYLDPNEADTVINGYRRSPWNEDALKHDIGTLDSEEHPVPKDKHYWNAINHVAKLLKPEKPLQPVHFADLPRYKWTLSTNIGAPFATSPRWIRYVKAKFNYFRYGTPFEHHEDRDLFIESHKGSQPLEIKDARMTKHNMFTEMFTIVRHYIHRIKLGLKTDPSGNDLRFWNTAFARQHLVKKDDPDKVRLVFGAPFTLLTAELMFIWPLQVYLLGQKGTSNVMLWGYETILGGWYRLRGWFAQHAPRHQLFATLDWSGFDKKARHTVIADIHKHIIRPMFDFSKGYHPTITNKIYHNKEGDLPIEEKLENLWNWMTDAVLTTPLLLPDGTMYGFRHSGIFSGYMQTQILDSLYNLVMIFTILSAMGFDLDKVLIKVQGDDSIFAILCAFLLVAHSFLSFFKSLALHYFGAVLNEKKSEIRDSLEDAEVLRYRNSNGLPYREELQLLAQLRHPERSTRPEDVAARCIGIAYASVGRLPRTYMICKDIFEYLVIKKEIVPNQRELDRFFKYVDFSPTTAHLNVNQFPTYLDIVGNLMMPERDLVKDHWPEDYFIGRPGCY